MKVKVKSQSCLTLCDPMDCSLPGSSVHGIFQHEYWSGLPLEVYKLMYITRWAWASQLAQWLKIRLPIQETLRYEFKLWVGKIPWRRKWQPTPVFLPWKSHGLRSLVGYSPCGCKELDMTEWFHFHFFIFLLKFSLLCFIATVHDHENGEWLGVESWPRTHF